VIRGFDQKKGIDYFDTYSPVIKIAIIRTLVSLVALYSLVVHQMDMRTAFLNGNREENIYMSQLRDVLSLGRKIKSVSLENPSTT